MRRKEKDKYRVVKLRTDAVYRPKIPMEEPVYAYIRVCKQDEVGFSVIDHIAQYPDFSNCGVFWVAPDDFEDLFEEC